MPIASKALPLVGAPGGNHAIMKDGRFHKEDQPLPADGQPLVAGAQAPADGGQVDDTTRSYVEGRP